MRYFYSNVMDFNHVTDGQVFGALIAGAMVVVLLFYANSQLGNANRLSLVGDRRV
jgi:hypothetical protein